MYDYCAAQALFQLLSSQYVYVHSFAPSPAQLVGDLHTNFHVNGKLLVTYSRSKLWA